MSDALDILQATDRWVAVDKPAGLASIPERRPDEPCVQRRLEAQLGARLWVVHRLDKDVTGVLLFARDADAHRHLCRAFETRTAHKTYLGVAVGRVAADYGRLDAPLRAFGSGRMGVDAACGKASLTEFRVLERLLAHTLLELRPLTGRRHQLRVHLYAAGHPLLGDPFYGTPEQRRSGMPLMLHALALQCPGPDGPIAVEAPPPPDFTRTLAALGGRWPVEG